MKKTFAFVGIILLAALLAFPAFAETKPQKIDSLWVSTNADGSDSIEWFKSKNGDYYLFLPGNMAKDNLTLNFSGADSIEIGGVTFSSGDFFPYEEGKEDYVLSCGGKKYKLHCLTGSSGLPALYITTESGNLDYIHKSKQNKEKGTLLFIGPDGKPQYDGNLTHIKIRGNSSTKFKKKNYQIKLEDGTNLMDMGKCRTWILTGNNRDKSLLRNQITMDMALYSGLSTTPEHITADVYINHEYMGAYLFSEKVMIDDDRIDIFDLEKATEDMNDGDLSQFPMVGPKEGKSGEFKAYSIPEIPYDITGEYLIEYESYPSRYKEEASAYFTSHKGTLVVKSPEFCSKEQMEYISGFMQSFENAIFSPDGNDPATGKHYSQIIDMSSLVRKYMIEEISKNYDGNSSSMFFYKPEDSQSTLAFAGPVWDYDSAYGSYAREDNQNKVLPPKGFWIKNAGGKYWWPALYKQPDFQQEVKNTWNSVFSHAMKILLGEEIDEGGHLHSLDEYADMISDSARMNFIRWPIVKSDTQVAQTGLTFGKNIDFLKDFIQKRYEFLDKEWGSQ